MVINISIYDPVNVTMFLTKRNVNTFDVLTFIQIRVDKRNTGAYRQEEILTNDYVKKSCKLS